MSLTEYLALERTSDVRHEYINGEAYAMAGGSPRHSAVCANIVVALGVALRGRPCRVFQSDLRVHVDATGMYTYPDVAVVCGQLVTAPMDGHSAVNPRALVEVLSPNTEAHDRGAKFKHYQTIATLEEYVLVDPDDRRVEVYRRVKDRGAQWLLTTYTAGAVEMADVAIPFEDIYAQLEGLAS